ncbi:GNAT family acetyltransferase [Myceligenerans cantabricum]
MSRTTVAADFTEITDDDVAGVVALWHASGLTRPWNDPHVDIADARSGPTSTILVFRDDDKGPVDEVAATGTGSPAAGDALTSDDETTPGSVVASVMAGLDGHRGWLYYIAVAPGRQGGGLGRAAVAAGEEWLRAAGARKVMLMVRSSNSAVVDFYARLGYADQETTTLGRWF